MVSREIQSTTCRKLSKVAEIFCYKTYLNIRVTICKQNDLFDQCSQWQVRIETFYKYQRYRKILRQKSYSKIIYSWILLGNKCHGFWTFDQDHSKRMNMILSIEYGTETILLLVLEKSSPSIPFEGSTIWVSLSSWSHDVRS